MSFSLSCEKCGTNPETFHNYKDQILCPSCFKKELKKHNKAIKCAKCGKKTMYYTKWYGKEVCIKCDMIARQLRTIRYNGNKILKGIMQDIYALEQKK